jgi:hypothetical protein
MATNTFCFPKVYPPVYKQENPDEEHACFNNKLFQTRVSSENTNELKKNPSIYKHRGYFSKNPKHPYQHSKSGEKSV